MTPKVGNKTLVIWPSVALGLLISNHHSRGQVAIRTWWPSNDHSNSKAVRSDDTTPASHRERTQEKGVTEVLQCPA